ncbi:MAG: hypothetical protein LBE57_02130 [Methanosarcinales archaeon]|jgi:hypothetical protein|nr:hypothetical protein [Methanosarcinales archaeon]
MRELKELAETYHLRKYWSDLKLKFKAEGNELSDKIGQLKMKAHDGKMRMTDAMGAEQLFRLV